MSTVLGSRWFHGRITRDNACHLLLNHQSNRKDGLFLVRESTHKPGNFVISLLLNGECQHFQIVHQGDAWYSLDNGPVFQGLDQLVAHYQSNSHGLPVVLAQPIHGQNPPQTSLKRSDTELHRAVLKDNVEHVTTILSQPITAGLGVPTSRNEDGCTPLHLAAGSGNLEIVKACLAHGADPSIRDSTGTTALHIATRNNHCEVIRALIEGGANVQERNATTQWVALHEAAFRGNVEACEMLLFMNSPVQPRTLDGELPRSLAKRYGKTEVVKLLDFAIANYPSSRTNVNDWLHKRFDRQRAVQMLASKGAMDGMFVVRPHSSKPNHYALTVMFQKTPYHFEIVSESDRLYWIDDGPMFPTLSHVIDHYMMFADGLPTRLLHPVPPPGCPPPRKSTAPPPGEILFPRLSNKATSPKFQQPPPTAPKPGAAAPPLPQSSSRPPPLPPPPEEVVAALSGNQKREILSIERKDLRLSEELGTGEFSSVLKGVLKTPSGTEVHVAVKKLKPNAIGHNQQEFMREASVMSDLDHRCIVKFIGICKDSPSIMLVQELVPLGSLLNYLYHTRDTAQQPDLNTLKLWAAEIACGMVYLEQKRFVHRDLAARNILIASMKQVKISDFGLSRTLGANSNHYQASQGGKWPVKWYAPESINYGTFSSASDVWSYGVTLWEMFSFGEHPYGEWTGTQVLVLIEDKGYRLNQPSACPSALYGSMLQCWSLEPSNRPTFMQLHSMLSASDDFKGVPHAELYALTKDVKKAMTTL